MKRKTSKATKPHKPVHKKKAQSPAFETLSREAIIDTLDAALTAAEAHLQKLLPGFPPRQITCVFSEHVLTHATEELSNIAKHGHRNDSPEDKPGHLETHDWNGELPRRCTACGMSETEALDSPCPKAQDSVPNESELLRDVRAALDGLLTQVYQMQGMFDDEDGNIADAVPDAEEALERPLPANIEASKLAAFAGLIARMKTEDEFGDDPPPSEDWISTVNDLIDQARKITGIDPKHEKPKPEDE